MVYVLLTCTYVFIGVILIAYMNGTDESCGMFETADLLCILFWPVILVAAVVYRPIACVYRLFFALGRKAIKRKKAKRNN